MVDLRAELGKLGLDTKGVKAVLQARLREALEPKEEQVKQEPEAEEPKAEESSAGMKLYMMSKVLCALL